MAVTRKPDAGTRTELLFQRIADETSDGILVMAKDGTVLYVNPAARDLLGYSGDAPFVLRADDLFGISAEAWRSIASHVEVSERLQQERSVQRSDGSSFPAELRWSALGNEQTVVFLHDISDRKRGEEQREGDQRLYEIIAENLPNSMTLIINRDYRYLYSAGPEAARLGWDREFLVGKRMQDIVPAEGVALVEEYCRRSLSGETVNFHIQVAGNDYNASAAPLFATDGSIDRILIIAQNITPQMQIFREHQEIEERYRSIFQNSHAVMLLVDTVTGIIMDANAAAIRFYGWPLATLRTMRIAELSADPHPEAVTHRRGTSPEPSAMSQLRHRLANGEIRHVEVYSGPIILRGRQHLLLIVHDASGRHRAERALSESEARYHSLFERAGDAIVLLDQTVIVDCNAKTLEFFQGGREAIVGRDILDLLPEQQPGGIASAEKVKGFMERTLRGEVPHCQWLCRRLDGTTFDAELTLSSFAVPGKSYVLALIRDVTERLAIEHQLERSLEEKVILLREIHHRVKNNMQVVSSLLNLQASAVQSQEARNALRDSQDRIRSMALIHEKLYGTADLTAVTMDAYARELIDYLCRSYGRPEINVVQKLEEIRLKVDRAIPCGLILNELLSNTFRHAYPAGRRGTVTITCGKEGEHEAVLCVADDGIGLAEGLDVKTATTLGLLLVNILTDQIGGTLTVDRSAGTTFRVRFPLA